MKEFSLLIVEDNISSREGLAKSITGMELGIAHIYTAKNGQEALTYLRKLKIDIVLTDICMPQMDGLELIQCCRAEKHRVEFIIISGFEDFRYAQTAIRYGVKAYLLKPVSVEELCKELKTMIESLKEKGREPGLSGAALAEREKELFLQKIIKGDILPENIQAAWRRYLLPETGRYLAVVMDCLFFHEEGYDKGLIAQEAAVFFQDRALSGRYEIILTNANQFVLLLFPEKESPEFMRETIEEFNRRLNKKLRHDVYFGVGSEVSAPAELTLSCQTAGKAAAYLLFEPENKVIWGEELTLSSVMPTAAQTEAPLAVYQAITEHAEEKIKEHLNTFFSGFFSEGFPPPHFVRGMCTYMVISVQTELEKLAVENDSAWGETRSYDVINNLWTISEIHRLLEGLFLSYSRYLQKAHTIIDPIMKKSLFFIKNNLDQPLHVNDVAGYVNLSPGYFSAYFKTKMKCNFKEYVVERKMEEAKRLISVEDLSLDEIALRVGYDQYRSFHRVFKKAEGISPSEYQKQRAEKG